MKKNIYIARVVRLCDTCRRAKTKKCDPGLYRLLPISQASQNDIHMTFILNYPKGELDITQY